jgi:hypothetical protein
MTPTQVPDRFDPQQGPDNGSAQVRRGPVLAAIAVTILLAGSVVAMLLYRSLATPEPNRVLVVRASKDWDGVELIVDGGTLDKPKVTWVEALGNYTVPFFLHPGTYTLHVKSHDVEVLTREFNLTEPGIQQIDLTRSGATTRPAPLTTRPSTMTAEAGASPPLE